MIFETEWMGGRAERLFAKHRGNRIDTFDFDRSSEHLAPEVRDRLRRVWTQSAHQEWCAAGAFNAMLGHLIQARAPIDLIGMAGTFVADEMVHVELASRMAMVFGGGIPLEVDPLATAPDVSDAPDVLTAAVALAVRVSCVGESFSLPTIGNELHKTADPLTQAVLKRIIADEGPHATVGWLVLEWAEPHLTPARRDYIDATILDALEALEPAMELAGHERPLYEALLERHVKTPLEQRGFLPFR